MAIRVLSDMHRRRMSRNLGLGVVLGGLVALVFVLTLVKIRALGVDGIEAFDHQPRPTLAETGQ